MACYDGVIFPHTHMSPEYAEGLPAQDSTESHKDILQEQKGKGPNAKDTVRQDMEKFEEALVQEETTKKTVESTQIKQGESSLPVEGTDPGAIPQLALKQEVAVKEQAVKKAGLEHLQTHRDVSPPEVAQKMQQEIQNKRTEQIRERFSTILNPRAIVSFRRAGNGIRISYGRGGRTYQERDRDSNTETYVITYRPYPNDNANAHRCSINVPNNCDPSIAVNAFLMEFGIRSGINNLEPLYARFPHFRP